MLTVLAMLLILPGPAAPDAPKRVATILASGDGKTQATAYRVRSVAEEHRILRHLGLRPEAQRILVMGEQSFDVVSVTDPATGASHDIWFDISSFYAKGFDL